ncbi:extracellular solute-binding protein [Lichenicoccus sp.]|uniref:extracellular solute-binding protein n=1 Tax=Lichenicoccus sp. TaxID=2781899 RepID=UPI003D0AF086
MRPSLSRRLLLGGFAGASLATRGSFAAAAPARTIGVGCWGGAFAAALDAVVAPPLLRNDHITVRQVVSDEQDRVMRVVTPTPQTRLDVALLSDTDAYRLSLAQLFVPVTTDGVRSLPRILPGMRAPYGVPQSHTALCIVYDRARLHEAGLGRAPRSFEAMFKAAQHGKVGFSSELAIHNLAAAAIAQRSKSATLEAGKSTFLSLKKSGALRLYPTNDALGDALAKGEIVMAPMWRARTYVWQQAGRDVRDSIPVEGLIPFSIVASVPKGVTDSRAAMLTLEELLHPETQVAIAKRTGLLPTVIDAHLDAALQRRIGFTAFDRTHLRPLSLDAVARHGVALRHFWDQELA